MIPTFPAFFTASKSLASSIRMNRSGYSATKPFQSAKKRMPVA